MKNLFLVTLSVLVFVISCDSEKTFDANYNSDSALVNISDNIILPRYNKLLADVTLLQEAINAIPLSGITDAELFTMKSYFTDAYLSWQSTTSFIYFGPADDHVLIALNSFPTNANKIIINIEENDFNLESGANTDAIGFPALDYMLFNSTSENVIEKLKEKNYQNYTIALIDQIATKINAVTQEWEASYSTKFKNGSGSDIGSSISLLTNSMIHDFEAGGREAKIGIPAGVRTLNDVLPGNVEAYYSQISIALAKKHIIGIKELIEGKNGDSYTTILMQVEKSSISTTIVAQLDSIQSALDILNDPFSEALEQDNLNALEAYKAYQKLLPTFKIDLTAALGLLISYEDSDGD
ncbi:MAG: imelysin family protein [Saprospiraceae bacterium]